MASTDQSLSELLEKGAVMFTDAFRSADSISPFKFQCWSQIDVAFFNKLNNPTSNIVLNVNPPQPTPSSIYTIPKMFNFDTTYILGGVNDLHVTKHTMASPISMINNAGTVCYNYKFDAWENFNMLLQMLYKSNVTIDECLYVRIADCLKTYIELVLPIRVTFDSDIRPNHIGLLLNPNVKQSIGNVLRF